MDPDDKTPSSFDSNNSFVVIQKMSAENQKQIELTDNLIKNSVIEAIIDKFNAEPITKNHPLAEDIEKSVGELIKENAKLRDTLQENNASMKQQCRNLEKWFEETRNIQKSYKRKLDETKDIIFKLRTENNELKRPVQDAIRATETRFINEKTKLHNENHMLKEKLTTSHHNLNKFEQRLAANAEKEKELIQIIANLSKQLESSEKARRKLMLEVDRLSNQESKLQRLLSPNDSKSVTNTLFWNAIFPAAAVYAPEEAQLIENLKQYEGILNTDDSAIIEPNSSVESDHMTMNEDVESLKVKLKDLQEQLTKEQTININRKKIIDEARTNFGDIYKQFVTILKGYNIKSEAQEIETIRSREKLKLIESLRHELSDRHNRVIQLEAEICSLEKKLKEAERKSDDLYFLQSQIKVYEEDFLTERAAKETLVDEKLQLERDISCLKQNNEELMKQLRITTDDELNNLSSEPRKSSEPIENVRKFVCFNDTCHKSFATEDELTKHIYSCLNLKD